MKLALLGYGAMGQLVAAQAQAAGDEIGATLTSKDAARSVEEMANVACAVMMWQLIFRLGQPS